MQPQPSSFEPPPTRAISSQHHQQARRRVFEIGNAHPSTRSKEIFVRQAIADMCADSFASDTSLQHMDEFCLHLDKVTSVTRGVSCKYDEYTTVPGRRNVRQAMADSIALIPASRQNALGLPVAEERKNWLQELEDRWNHVERPTRYPEYRYVLEKRKLEEKTLPPVPKAADYAGNIISTFAHSTHKPDVIPI